MTLPQAIVQFMGVFFLLGVIWKLLSKAKLLPFALYLIGVNNVWRSTSSPTMALWRFVCCTRSPTGCCGIAGTARRRRRLWHHFWRRRGRISMMSATSGCGK